MRAEWNAPGHSLTPQIRAVAERFAAMHPMAHAPSVWLVVGSGVSGGSASGGRRPMILEELPALALRPAGLRCARRASPDLDCWMGYRITKSFHDQATDKEQAIREILMIRDFPRFLERSGYRGGDGGATAPAPAGG